MKNTKRSSTRKSGKLPLRYIQVMRNINKKISEKNQWFWREVYRNKKATKKSPGNITAIGGGYDSRRVALEAANKYSNRLKVKLKVLG